MIEKQLSILRPIPVKNREKETVIWKKILLYTAVNYGRTQFVERIKTQLLGLLNVLSVKSYDDILLYATLGQPFPIRFVHASHERTSMQLPRYKEYP